MLQVDRRFKGLRLRELYFAKEDFRPATGFDLAQVVQSTRPFGPGATVFHSLLIDLSLSEDTLFGNMSKNCRYEIRRAKEKDGLSRSEIAAPAEKEITRFCENFAPFARATGIAPANRSKMLVLAEARALILTATHAQSDRILAQHAYLHDGARIRLLYSVSGFRGQENPAVRALSGRANRLLHWEDMLSFKRQGFKSYDLGGVALTEAMAGIDRFKQEFGGTPVQEWNSLHGVSLAGRVACLAHALRGWWSNRKGKTGPLHPRSESKLSPDTVRETPPPPPRIVP